MSEEMKNHLKNTNTWMRLLYMLLFVVIFNVAEIVIAVVVILQIILTLFAGARNRRLLEFGSQMSAYAYQILRYLTYNSDEAPFPFAEWPREYPVVKTAKGLKTGKDSGRRTKVAKKARPAEKEGGR